MSTYLLPLTAGTISISNNTKPVTGSGTLWAAGAVLPGDLLQIGLSFFTIGATDPITNTALSLVDNFTGYVNASGTFVSGAVSGIAYKIHRVGPGHGSVSNLNTLVTEVLRSIQTGFAMTSVSSLAIDTGAKTFVVPSGMPILPGARMRASSDANPTTHWMEGVVTSYSGTSLVLTVPATPGNTAGSGTRADWSINIAGAQGANGVNATTPGTTVVGRVPVWGDTGGLSFTAGFAAPDLAAALNTFTQSMRIDSTLSVGASMTVGDNADGSATEYLNAATDTTRQLVYRTAGVDRWGLRTVNDAEGGSNTGCAFELRARNDAGGDIGAVWQATRATRILNFTFSPTVGGNTMWHAGNDGAGSGLDADLLDGKNIGTSGNTVPLNNGNNVLSGTNDFTQALGLSSGQINFPATQVPSAGANVLDDYEEGTFTPVIQGTTTAGAGTYTTQIARYTKIGRVVTFNINLNWTAHTGTGNMKVTGLPFSVAGVSPSVCLRVTSLTFSNTLQAYGSGSEIILETVATGAAPVALPIDTAATILISGTYTI